MSWILFIFIFTPGGVVKASADFSSEELCRRAQEKVLNTRAQIEAVCVPKEKQE